MGLIPKLDYQYYPANPDPANYTTSARVYLKLTDENNQPVNGNNVIVTVKITYYSGTSYTQDISIPGSSQLIYDGELTRSINGILIESLTFQIVSISEATTPIPSVNDAHIDSVTINKKESAPFAYDAIATINAFSSYQPIEYAIDNLPYQSYPTFSGLTAGLHTAKITDANGNTATLAFEVKTTASLLVSDPSVDLGGGNTSRWSAAFNPIIFTYQRKDFEVNSITPSNDINNPGTVISVNGDLFKVAKDDIVYVNAGDYKGSYTVKALPDYNSVIIDTPFTTSNFTNGFLNSDVMRSYYNIATTVTYQDKLSNQTKTIKSTNRPDATGLVKADLSSFLQSLLVAKDNSDYTTVNFRDSNLSASYQVSYSENWSQPNADGTPDIIYSSTPVTISTPFYVTYTAKQLGSKYGGNMATYVPFKNVINPDQRAKWITDFNEPAYSNGYPFDIGFIYSEDMLGLNLYYELIILDANRKPFANNTITSYLLNEDGSYLLNHDSSKLIIKQNSIGSPSPLTPNQLGLNRLLINTDFPPEAYYFTLTLKYTDGQQNAHAVTQTQTVRIDDAVDDNSVYLRWIGLTGSWNYYRFVYNQEVSLDVQNAVIIKNYVTDLANQEGIEEVISKSAGEKMKVMAEDLSVNDIRGLQSIKYSPKVQMLVNRNAIKWQTVVINSATFSEYETRYGQYAFSVTFNKPSINIQTQ